MDEPPPQYTLRVRKPSAAENTTARWHALVNSLGALPALTVLEWFKLGK